MTIIKTTNSNRVFKRKSDGFIFGNEIKLGKDFSTGVERDDLAEYYEEVRSPDAPKLPPLSPYAVVIPEIYQWAFPEDKFVLSGFEIPLDTHNNDKVVNLAYFMWSEFRAELDSGNYVALKRSLMELWDYVKLQADTIGPWMQDPQNNQLSDKVIIL
jgi:hypothetical protein